MPILAAEPDVYPERLFDSPPPEWGERVWRVLHTKPRQEKSLARQLYEARIPFFLPLTARRNLIRGRVVTSLLPLFTGYAFVLGDDAERVQALRTNRVVRVLEVRDQGRLHQDLAQVQRLIELKVPLAPEDRLVAGAAVEIRSGPLKGLCGKIIRAANGRRFVVEVNFIQRAAAVELDDFMLGAVSD